MDLQLTYHPEPTLLAVEVQGQWTASNVHEAIGAARIEADKRKLRSLLVDIRGLSLPDSETTRFLGGVRWAELFDARFRAAFVVRAELYNGFAEIVARNRGANIAMFFDEGSARKWLNEVIS